MGRLLHFSSLSVVLSLMAPHKELLRTEGLMYLPILNSLIHASFWQQRFLCCRFERVCFQAFFFNPQYLKKRKSRKEDDKSQHNPILRYLQGVSFYNSV